MSTTPDSEDGSGIATAVPRVLELIPMQELVQPTMIEFEVTDQDGDVYRFAAMRGYLCAYSRYFKTLFQGKWADANTRTIKIKDHQPWVIACFINWLHIQTISLAGVSHKSPLPGGTDPEDPNTWPYRTLFMLYAFAEYHDVPILRTAAIRQVQMKLIINLQNPKPAGYPSREDVEYLVSEVPKESQLRRFLGSMAINARFLFEYVDADDYLRASYAATDGIKCDSCRGRRFHHLATSRRLPPKGFNLSCPNHVEDKHREPYKPRTMCTPAWHEHENELEAEQCQQYMGSVTGVGN